ncbi:phosphomannomutase/phosphoglucomutase [candidate division WWE3 bacterium]|nr:phosphomannomutase/phosphoglucomutase [candidate division WWE3 bacterium]
MQLGTAIFRDYDIRGVVPDELNGEIAEEIGRASGTYLQLNYGKSVVVGRDNRVSSKELSESLISGLVSTGVAVIDIGLSLTPVAQFLTHFEGIDAAVMVTASHNPKEFNGFKLYGKNADSISGQKLRDVLKIADAGNFKSGIGNISTKNFNDKYYNYLVSSFSFGTGNKLRILADCGDGAVGIFVPRIYHELGLNCEGLYCDLDRGFPHGVPDPESDTIMEGLSRKVVEGKFDLGFVFDTDEDRFGVVDEMGNKHETDKLLLLFSKKILTENPGKTVVFDVKSGESLARFVLDKGGNPKMIQVGHHHFVDELKKGAVLGAEYSGHVYFGDRYFGFDDGLYTSLRLIELILNEEKSLSGLMAEFPKTYHTREIKIACSDNEKNEFVAGLGRKIHSDPSVVKVIEIDGIRAYLDETSWFLVRPSNTNPYLSVRLESSTLEGFNKVKLYLSGFHPLLNEISNCQAVYS